MMMMSENSEDQKFLNINHVSKAVSIMNNFHCKFEPYLKLYLLIVINVKYKIFKEVNPRIYIVSRNMKKIMLNIYGEFDQKVGRPGDKLR